MLHGGIQCGALLRSYRKVLFLSHHGADADRVNKDGDLCLLTCRLYMQSSGRLYSFAGPARLRCIADYGDKIHN